MYRQNSPHMYAFSFVKTHHPTVVISVCPSHAHTFAYAHIHPRTHNPHTHVHARTNAHIHARTITGTHTCTPTHTTHTYTRTHARTHAQTHTHTHNSLLNIPRYISHQRGRKCSLSSSTNLVSLRLSRGGLQIHFLFARWHKGNKTYR